MNSISVIISTYNQPEWLRKCLWSYEFQSFREFEVIIADDGSGEETRKLIAELASEVRYPIQHVWHEDTGFEKCRILNKATLAANSDYLFYSDGDCLAREDLLLTHVNLARKGSFLSGSYFKLTLPVSQSLTTEHLNDQSAFSPSFLAGLGQPRSLKMLKLMRNKWGATLLDAITTTRATWNGHASSGWKEDILAVNGYNEQMKYGGEDRELGERLVNLGITPIQIRHRSCLLHLDHERGYNTPEGIAFNKSVRKRTVGEKLTWTDHGIAKGTRNGEPGGAR